MPNNLRQDLDLLLLSRSEAPLWDTPRLYARMTGTVLEIVTDRLTLRLPSGRLVAIEDHVREFCTHGIELRVMTLEEAPFPLSDYVIAPPLARAA